MGADGHITIWRDETVRAVFADCDELFSCLPTHYTDFLDNTLYHHCYHGDNLFCDWRVDFEWYLFDEKNTPKFKSRLIEFCAWLEQNGTHWEVWT